MPEIICADCGFRIFHENENTAKIEEAIHKKFCRKKPGDSQSYMHRTRNKPSMDSERELDNDGKPVLKR